MKPTIPSFKQMRTKVTAAIFFFLFLLALILFLLTGDSRNFLQLTKQFFVSELTGNTLNMHYTIANPASFGIKSYDAVLPAYSAERRAQSKEELGDIVASLKDISPDRLREKEAYAYNLLLPYLETEQAGLQFTHYSNPVSPSSGMQSQLPILLAEYAFRSQRDVLDYLAILDQTDTYFDGVIAYLKEQSSQGLFMPDTSVAKVMLQCRQIMDQNSVSSGTHFLQTTFAERVDQLQKDGQISETQRDTFLAENNRLLSDVLLPSYQRLGDALSLLKGSGTNDGGLSAYPEGRDYYLYLLRSNVSTYRDIEEIKLLLFDDFNANYEKLISLVKATPALTDLSVEAPFPFEDASDMLKNLQTMMAEDYPPLTDVANGQLPVCTVKSVSKNLEDYCSPAFYLTPPLDDIRQNVIYINRKDDPYGIDLYTTLAHEGYPGHLYQTVYSQLYFGKEDINPVRSLLNYSGYVEGWAMYVELNSFEYAKQVMNGKDASAAALYESYKLNRQLQLCVYSLLDIAIHYEGASYGQVHKMLAAIGISNSDMTRAIYEYITEEPTTYMKYYVGYLEIMELQKKAKELWGEDYSNYRFHKFFLEAGPSDFSSLERRLTK